MFFDLALPLILFAAGFNMRRKQFFKNFANITKFGIFGSLITYAVYVTLFYILFKYGNLTFTDPMEDDKGVQNFDPPILDIMLFCSIIVSSDIIAAMSIIDFNELPHIFSIILGEGLFNDVIVFTLKLTVEKYQIDPEEAVFGVKEALDIFIDFIKLCLLSLLIGMIAGFLVTYILKKVRTVSHSAIHEVSLLLIVGFLTYFSSEILG